MAADKLLPEVVLTVGHSNRPIGEFLALLTPHKVKLVADVRKLPGSRANPQFGGEALVVSLKKAGIDYVHLRGLGGLRKGSENSPNGGWRNTSFRAFADYMQTPEFEASLADLLDLAAVDKTAIMCSEAVPWRCHRSLIADALVIRGIRVEHILTKTRADKHALHGWARLDGLHITYPPEELPLFASAAGKK